jgi:hypothetical protein
MVPHHRDAPLSLQIDGDPPTPPVDHLPGDQIPQRRITTFFIAPPRMPSHPRTHKSRSLSSPNLNAQSNSTRTQARPKSTTNHHQPYQIQDRPSLAKRRRSTSSTSLDQEGEDHSQNDLNLLLHGSGRGRKNHPRTPITRGKSGRRLLRPTITSETYATLLKRTLTAPMMTSSHENPGIMPHKILSQNSRGDRREIMRDNLIS